MKKRLAIWLGLAAVGWTVILTLAMCAKTAWAQNPIPDSVTNKALEGFDHGGYKAVAVVALAAVIAMAFFVVFLLRVILKLVDKLEALSTRSTDIAARAEDAIENNTRWLESAKAELAAFRR